MIENTKQEYSVKTCPIAETEDLEILLNEMGDDGWELFMMNESESKDGDIVYNCIFTREYQEFIQTESAEILDVSDFKSRMEKMVSTSDEPYEICKDTQAKIAEKSKTIEKIKEKLENATQSKERDQLNEELSSILTEMEMLKDELSLAISPFRMYERVGQDKVVITLSDELTEIADPKQNGSLISETVKLRQKLTDEIGYILPAVKFTNTEPLEANEYRIDIRGFKAISGTVYPGYRRIIPEQANLTRKPKDAIEETDPITGERVFWVQEEKTKDFWEKGQTPSEVISEHLEAIAIKHADELMDYNDVSRYMEMVAVNNLYLIEHIVPQLVSIGDIKYILSNLIKERVSIKDITYVFEKLNDNADQTKDKNEHLKIVRIALSKQISQKIADESGNIYTIFISKEKSEELENMLEGESDKLYFPTYDPKVKKLVKKITTTMEESECSTANMAIICHSAIRMELFDLLSKDVPNIKVLSYEEAANNFNYETIAKI